LRTIDFRSDIYVGARNPGDPSQSFILEAVWSCRMRRKT
jgi:hypothetical protein